MSDRYLTRIITTLLLLVASIATAVPLAAHAQSSPFPLEILNIKPAGTGNPPIPATNRIFRAYPGIEYNIRPAVIGGTYPYQFALRDAPNGMTVNPDTGEISWPNPQSNAGPITLTVTDSQGKSIQTSWSITTTTSGFWFVDSKYTGVSTGSITQPFKSVVEMLDNTQGHETDIVYFRGGNYALSEYPLGIGKPTEYGPSMYVHITFDGKDLRKPETWIAYPGEGVNIDQQGVLIRTNRPWFDGLNFYNAVNFGLWTHGGNHYISVRRSTFNQIRSNTSSNINQGFIFSSSSSSRGYGWVIQDNSFSDFVGAQAIGSLYDTDKALIEDNHTFDGGHVGPHHFATPVGLKNRNPNTTIRGNRFELPGDGAEFALYIGGGGHEYMDLSYNLIYRQPGTNKYALTFFYPTHVHAYRNTFVGDILFRPSLSQGPYYFSKNVIIGRLVDDTYVTKDDNLMGSLSDNIVDSAGNLTSAYQEYLGTHGYQLRLTGLLPPSNVRISSR
jgi:hypothetical protein